MIESWQLPMIMAGGACAGLGVFVAVREILPAAPAIGPALRRRHSPAPAPGRPATTPQPSSGTGSQVLDRLTALIRVPERELALLGRTRREYLISLLASAMVGLLLPPLAGFALASTGVGLPVVIPVGAGIAGAIGFAMLAHRDVLAKAKAARREFARAVCVYLDLVALQLSAAHGPVQSLEQAAEVCQGWVFARIRQALHTARLQAGMPWAHLREMAARIGVPELGDVGAIMQASGSDGAQVSQSLRAQADSLRDQIRTDALARAEAITGRLDIPGAALVFVLVIFVLYPFMARL